MGYASDVTAIRRRYEQPNFRLVSLSDVTTMIQYGTSRRATAEPVGTPVLRIPNLQRQGWDLRDLKYLTLSPEELLTYRLDKGDIVFNRTNGSRDLVGKCEVFDLDGDWAFASYLIRLKLDETRVVPRFLSAFLNSRWGRRQIEHVSRQILMSNINAQEIRELRVPLPKLATQRRLVRVLDSSRQRGQIKLDQAQALLQGADDFITEALSLDEPSALQRPAYAVKAAEVCAARRLHPSYFHPERLRMIRAIAAGKAVEARSLSAVGVFVRQISTVSAADDYLGLADVEPNTGELVRTGERSGSGACFHFKKNDVLLARLRPYLNKVFRAESDGVCSTEFHVIRVRRHSDGTPVVEPEYLAAITSLKSGSCSNAPHDDWQYAPSPFV